MMKNVEFALLFLILLNELNISAKLLYILCPMYEHMYKVEVQFSAIQCNFFVAAFGHDKRYVEEVKD